MNSETFKLTARLAYSENPITNWQQFRQLTSKNRQLLKKLDQFPDSVLVAGCQRSGTTMLSRIITESEGMKNYWFGTDDELAAALILSGLVKHEPQGRYCFQTTYLDDHYYEYLYYKGSFKLVWVLRNPFSVVYSLVYNWRKGALENTFKHCGAQLLSQSQKWKYHLFGSTVISRVLQASLLYVCKVNQLFELSAYLGRESILVIDYDDLVLNRENMLRQIFEFINERFRPDYALKIHQNSLQKFDRLTETERSTIRTLSEPRYMEARRLCTAP